LNAEIGHDSVGMHRIDLLQLLADAVPDDCVHLNSDFRYFDQDQDGVTATFADGHSVAGDLLIGADGVFSSVRGRLCPGRRPSYAGYVCWRGVAEFDPGDEWPVDASVRTMGPGQHFGIVHVKGRRFFWYATRTQAKDEPEPGGRKATLLRHFGRWHQPIPAIIEATPEDEVLRHGIYDMRGLREWGTGHVSLLGDAAHPMRPSLGMGACQAMEDAVVLAHYLENLPAPEALRAYERHRRPRAKGMVRGSRLLATSEQLRSRALCALRDMSPRLMPEFVVLRLAELGFRFEIP
jgi:2-polyprenyl-6-methoxyphenol hydroxylase-like FAD-dependent oxidoreductase